MGRKEMAKGGILDGRPRATDLQGGMLSPDLQCDILTPNMQGQDLPDRKLPGALE